MGTLLSSKLTSAGKILLTIVMDREEALQLKGHVEDIFILSGKTAEVKTNIVSRGKNGATKYLIIPREMRKGIPLDKDVLCQRMDTKSNIIFIYCIDKF